MLYLLKHGSNSEGDTHDLWVMTIVAGRTVKLWLFQPSLCRIPPLLPFCLTSNLLASPAGPAEADFFCIGAAVLFVPLLPWLPARRLAAPCVKGGRCRTDCGNSRLASPCSPAPHPEGQLSIHCPPPALSPLPLHTHTHPREKPTTLTPSPNNPRKQFHLDSGGGPLSPAPSIFPY